MKISRKSNIVALFACLMLFLGLALGVTDINTRKVTASAATEKTVILSGTNGGSVYVEIDGIKSNLFTLNEGDEYTVYIKANSGYAIDLVTANGSQVQITNSKTMTLPIAYATLTDSRTVIYVEFVSASEKSDGESEGEGDGESEGETELQKAIISVAKKVSASLGGVLEIKADVTAYGDTNIYQWYKDGEALEDQTSDTLYIENAELTDVGEYSLKVTSFFGSSSVVAESDVIQVSVHDNSTLLLATKIILLAGGGLIVAFFVAIVIVAIIRKTKQKHTEHSAPESNTESEPESEPEPELEPNLESHTEF